MQFAHKFSLALIREFPFLEPLPTASALIHKAISRKFTAAVRFSFEHSDSAANFNSGSVKELFHQRDL